MGVVSCEETSKGYESGTQWFAKTTEPVRICKDFFGQHCRDSPMDNVQFFTHSCYRDPGKEAHSFPNLSLNLMYAPLHINSQCALEWTDDVKSYISCNGVGENTVNLTDGGTLSWHDVVYDYGSGCFTISGIKLDPAAIAIIDPSDCKNNACYTNDPGGQVRVCPYRQPAS